MLVIKRYTCHCTFILALLGGCAAPDSPKQSKAVSLASVTVPTVMPAAHNESSQVGGHGVHKGVGKGVDRGKEESKEARVGNNKIVQSTDKKTGDKSALKFSLNVAVPTTEKKRPKTKALSAKANVRKNTVVEQLEDEQSEDILAKNIIKPENKKIIRKEKYSSIPPVLSKNKKEGKADVEDKPSYGNTPQFVFESISNAKVQQADVKSENNNAGSAIVNDINKNSLEAKDEGLNPDKKLDEAKINSDKLGMLEREVLEKENNVISDKENVGSIAVSGKEDVDKGSGEIEGESGKENSVKDIVVSEAKIDIMKKEEREEIFYKETIPSSNNKSNVGGDQLVDKHSLVINHSLAENIVKAEESTGESEYKSEFDVNAIKNDNVTGAAIDKLSVDELVSAGLGLGERTLGVDNSYVAKIDSVNEDSPRKIFIIENSKDNVIVPESLDSDEEKSSSEPMEGRLQADDQDVKLLDKASDSSEDGRIFDKVVANNPVVSNPIVSNDVKNKDVSQNSNDKLEEKGSDTVEFFESKGDELIVESSEQVKETVAVGLNLVETKSKREQIKKEQVMVKFDDKKFPSSKDLSNNNLSGSNDDTFVVIKQGDRIEKIPAVKTEEGDVLFSLSPILSLDWSMRVPSVQQSRDKRFEHCYRILSEMRDDQYLVLPPYSVSADDYNRWQQTLGEISLVQLADQSLSFYHVKGKGNDIYIVDTVFSADANLLEILLGIKKDNYYFSGVLAFGDNSQDSLGGVGRFHDYENSLSMAWYLIQWEQRYYALRLKRAEHSYNELEIIPLFYQQQKKQRNCKWVYSG